MKIIYKHGHINALDGLRGIAILLVILTHLYEFGPFKIITEIGWVGVDLFFVLSGFLITGILLDSKRTKNYFRNFIVRRALRILPLYYLILIVFYFLDNYSNNPNFSYPQNQQLPYWLYIQNYFSISHNWINSGLTFYIGHFWSLAIEEQFYIFWPLAVIFFSSKNLLRLSLIMTCLSIITRNINPEFSFVYNFTLTRLDGLLIGSAIAILIREDKKILEKLILPTLWLSGIALCIILFISGPSNSSSLFIRIGYTLNSLFFGAILLLPFAKNKVGLILAKLLESKIFTSLGKYSYGIYVYHHIIYTVFSNKISESLGWLISDNIFNRLIASTICLIATFAISYLSFHLFEKHFLKLKAKFETHSTVSKCNV